MPSLFITATDTGVGKTIVTASLASVLRVRGRSVGAMKPFASGSSEDAELLREASALKEPIETLTPAMFRYPLAPLSSARLERRQVDVRNILQATRAYCTSHCYALVEGIGGVAVPLADKYLVGDFARDLGIPTLVVARTELGTINHTLLTLEHLRARQVPIFGVVFCRSHGGPKTLAEEVSPAEVLAQGQVRGFGTLPYVEELPRAQSPSEQLAHLPLFCDAVLSMVDALETLGAS